MAWIKNQSLKVDEPLYSDDQQYWVVLQKDGNLVLYNNQNHALWSSQTNGKAAEEVAMQEDGNLVIYGSHGDGSRGAAIWSSKTAGNTGASLSMQDDGNLVIYLGERAIWATKTGR